MLCLIHWRLLYYWRQWSDITGDGDSVKQVSRKKKCTVSIDNFIVAYSTFLFDFDYQHGGTRQSSEAGPFGGDSDLDWYNNETDKVHT